MDREKGDHVTKIIKLTPCNISFETYGQHGPYYSETRTVIFPVKASWESYNADWEDGSQFRGIRTSTGAEVVKVNGKTSKRSYTTSHIKIDYKEDNITDRIVKALKHLATFCEEKEAF